METNNQKKNAAFNLVELLVAIAIVAILAAILLSVIFQAKARGLRIGCANNVRQLGVALQEFKLDHNFYPPELDPGDQSENRNWKDALGYEMNIRHNFWQKGVWHCPAASRPANLDKDRIYNEYGYNAYGLGTFASTNSLGLSEYWQVGSKTTGYKTLESISRVNEPEVVCPADMYAVGDAFYGGPGVVRDGGIVLGRASESFIKSTAREGYDYSAATKRSYARHQGHANVVFCDGHVESPTLKFLFVETNDAALVCWNRDHLPHRERLAP